MAEPFPSEEVAGAVAQVVDGVGALGRFRDETGAIVVRLPRGAAGTGLPLVAAGYPVRYLVSELTRAEVQAACDAVVAIGQGPEARFTIGYDARIDRVRVNGYFPDESTKQRLRQIKGAELMAVERYEQSQAEWEQDNAAFARSVPAILARWSDFPSHERPRPIVVLDIPVRCAFLDNVPHPDSGAPPVVSSVPLPDGLLPLLTRHGAPAKMRPLHLIRAEAVHAWFMTDRGQRQLPAYELAFADEPGTCTVLDPAAPIWWPRTAEQWQGRRRAVRIEADDVTLHVEARGGQLTEFISVEVHESPTAVLAKPITREGAGPRRDVGIHRTMTTVLANPLGDRVLINEAGVPYVVVPVGASLRPRWWPDRPPADLPTP